MYNKNNVYNILKFSLETLDSIFEYKNDINRNKIINEVFDKVVLMSNIEIEFERICNLTEETNCINTVADANMINLEHVNSKDNQLALEIKSNIIIRNNINHLKTFNFEDFIDNLYRGTYEGIKNNCMLLAIINYFGIGIDRNIDIALKLWKVLAYNGSVEAMNSLIYAYKNENMHEEENKWIKIKEYFETCRKKFLMVSLEQKEKNKEIAEAVEKILAVLNRNILLKKQKPDYENLDFSLLYYISTSKDDHEMVMNNICNIEEDGFRLLLASNHFENKKYIF